MKDSGRFEPEHDKPSMFYWFVSLDTHFVSNSQTCFVSWTEIDRNLFYFSYRIAPIEVTVLERLLLIIIDQWLDLFNSVQTKPKIREINIYVSINEFYLEICKKRTNKDKAMTWIVVTIKENNLSSFAIGHLGQIRETEKLQVTL